MSILNNIISGLMVVVVLILSTVPHEVMHGYTAYLLGDNTAKWQRRLSLNPLKHINKRYVALILGGAFLGRLIPSLSFITDVFMWVGFLFLLIPVPVNPGNFSDPKKGMAIVGLMGPVTNFVIAFVSLIFFAYFGHIAYLGDFLWLLAIFNIRLGVFNIIPVPPLDGSRVLFAFLPQNYYFRIMQYERYIMIVFFILLWGGALDRLMYTGVNNILNAFLRVISAFPGI